MKYKYFIFIATAFVALLLISNIAAQKLTILWGFIFTGGIYLFPFTYIINDVVVEVYGYKLAKQTIWMAFILAAFMAIFLQFIVELPAAPGWNNQEAFATTLSQVPRIFIASLFAFWVGSFSNSISMAKIKILTKGKYLWIRTIGSTIIGEFLDTFVFALIAFYGIIPNDIIFISIASGFAFKVVYEILATPLTYLVINWFKRKENIDIFDYKTKFNPFSIEK